MNEYIQKPSQPSRTSDLRIQDNLLPRKQTDGVRLVGIESREIGLMDIFKSILLQHRSFKAV
jgi:hypothetical protein